MSTTTEAQACYSAIISQIGGNNIMAISGGRVAPIYRDDRLVGVSLPVSHGYRVEVELAADDTYTVRRIFKRGLKEFDKGTVDGVYNNNIGEVAYRASCYQNVEFGR